MEPTGIMKAGIMKATSITIFSIAAAIFGSSMARSEVAQTTDVRQEAQLDTVPGTGTEFLIVGNARCLAIQWHARQITFLLQPPAFTIETLKSIFLHLSEEYPAEEILEIDALSNDAQVERAKLWFAELQSFPFGNVPPPVRCASPFHDPLSATYFRTDGSERFIYYPSASTEGSVRWNCTIHRSIVPRQVTRLLIWLMHQCAAAKKLFRSF